MFSVHPGSVQSFHPKTWLSLEININDTQHHLDSEDKAACDRGQRQNIVAHRLDLVKRLQNMAGMCSNVNVDGSIVGLLQRLKPAHECIAYLAEN